MAHRLVASGDSAWQCRPSVRASLPDAPNAEAGGAGEGQQPEDRSSIAGQHLSQASREQRPTLVTCPGERAPVTGTRHSRQGDLGGAEKGRYRRAANSLPHTGLRPRGAALPGFPTRSGAPGSNGQRRDKRAGPRRPLLASPCGLGAGCVPPARWVASAGRAPCSEGPGLQADLAAC